MLVAAFRSLFLGFVRSQNMYEECITENRIVFSNHEENVSKQLNSERVMRIFLYRQHMNVINGVNHRRRQLSA